MRRLLRLAAQQKAVVFLICLLLAGGCATPLFIRLSSITLDDMGRLAAPAFSEMSGLAPSHRSADTLWCHNDSGDKALIYALDHHGKLTGRVLLQGIKARDWEDMTSFVLDGRPMLLVADAGDNNSIRNDVRIHVLEEPDPASLSLDKTVEVPVAWTISFSYEDGPRDCESVAVDVAEKTIYLVSKRRSPPWLYSLPLLPTRDPVARRLVPLNFIEHPSLLRRPVALPAWRFRDQPTGLDISGNRAVLLTYGEVYLFERRPQQSWADVFSSRAHQLPAHGLIQAEAICFDAEGRHVFVGGEGSTQHLKRYRLPDGPLASK